MKTIEMIVGLKVPDTTAITTLQTLQKLGFSKIKDVKKEDYYKFFIEGSENKFRENISKVDVLVNANKHLYSFEVKKDESVKISVKNINESNEGLLMTLKKRLGFKELKSIEKYTLWSLFIDEKSNEAVKTANKAAKDLLINEHYQEYKIL